jgi:hypothetical protein
MERSRDEGVATTFPFDHQYGNGKAIETYIIPFNIFVTPEFAKAHNVAMDNLTHEYFVNGDTSEIIKRYTRECVTQMLEEYPGLQVWVLHLEKEWVV